MGAFVCPALSGACVIAVEYGDYFVEPNVMSRLARAIQRYNVSIDGLCGP